MALDGLLEGYPVGHTAHWVFSLQFLKLNWRILVQKFVQRKITATNFDLDLVADTAHPDTLSAELIDTFSLPHEHDLQLLPIRIVIDVLSQLQIDLIALDWDVHRIGSLLKVNDDLTELVNLVIGFVKLAFVLLHLLEHLKLSLLRLIELLLKLADIGRGTLKLNLQIPLARLHTVMVLFPHISLLFNIDFLSQKGLFLQHSALQLDNGLLALAKADLELADFGLVGAPLSLHLTLMLTSQLGHFLDVLLALRAQFLLQLLYLCLQLSNLGDQTFLVVFFQQSVLLELLSNLYKFLLQLFSGQFTFSHHFLVLGDVFLQVVHHLQFLVESDQSVQFVLKFDLFLLECKLQLGIVSLVKQVCRIMLSCRCHSRDLLY